ncbi:unnamed protein product, partial [marine sediment metagenome]
SAYKPGYFSGQDVTYQSGYLAGYDVFQMISFKGYHHATV